MTKPATPSTSRQAKVFATALLASSLITPLVTYNRARRHPRRLVTQSRRIPVGAALSGLAAYAWANRTSSDTTDPHPLAHLNADPRYIALNVAGATAAALAISHLARRAPLSRPAALGLTAAQAALTAPAVVFAFYRAYPPPPLFTPYQDPASDFGLPDPDDA